MTSDKAFRMVKPTSINKYQIPSTAETLNLLAKSMDFTMPSGSSRQMADDFPVSTQEANTVADLYIKLKIQNVRQALLDILVSLNKAQE